jgi:PhnB protein
MGADRSIKEVGNWEKQMKATPRLLVPLVVVGLGFLLFSYTRASSDVDKAEVMALYQRQIAAYDKGNVDAIMACYSDDSDAVFFEDTIPFQLNKAALRKLNEMAYKSVSDFHARGEPGDILVSGNLAIVRSSIVNTWKDKSGTTHSQTSRYTQVDKKEDGKWLVWHEHFSVPYDPATGKAVLDAKS